MLSCALAVQQEYEGSQERTGSGWALMGCRLSMR